MGEDDVYVLQQNDSLLGEIEKTALTTDETTIVFTSTGFDRLSSIFPNLEQDTLWISQTGRNQKGGTYSHISIDNSVSNWNDSPVHETSWAAAIHLSDKGVSLRNP